MWSILHISHAFLFLYILFCFGATTCFIILLICNTHRIGNVPTNMWRLPYIANVYSWSFECEMLVLSHSEPCARYIWLWIFFLRVCVCILFSPAHIFSLSYHQLISYLLVNLDFLCLIHSIGSGCSCQLWQLPYNTDVSIWSSISQMRGLSLCDKCQCESFWSIFFV